MDLLTAFSEMCCPRGGNVHEFLGSMRIKCEELAAIGVTMGEKEYRSAIIKSLPEEMSKFASQLLTASHVIQPTTSINPDTLIDHISKEADRLAARRKRDGGSSGKGKQSASGTQDEAMVATRGTAGRRRKANATTAASKGTGHKIAGCPRKNKTTIQTSLISRHHRGSPANSRVSHQRTRTIPSPRTSLWGQLTLWLSLMTSLTGAGRACLSAACLS